MIGTRVIGSLCLHILILNSSFHRT